MGSCSLANCNMEALPVELQSNRARKRIYFFLKSPPKVPGWLWASHSSSDFLLGKREGNNFSPCDSIPDMDSQSAAGRQQVQHHHNEQVSYRIFLFLGWRNPTLLLRMVCGWLACFPDRKNKSFLQGLVNFFLFLIRVFFLFFMKYRFREKLLC